MSSAMDVQRSLLLLVMVTGCLSNLDVAFVIDVSDRMSEEQNWKYVKNFTYTLAERLPQDGATRIGIVLFNTTATVYKNLQWHFINAQVLSVIAQLPLPKVDPKTNISSALHLTRTQLFHGEHDRVDVPNVAILITQDASGNTQNTVSMAEELRSSGVKIMCIGITDAVDEDELRSISSPPQQLNVSYFIVPSFDSLFNIADEVVENAMKIEMDPMMNTSESTTMESNMNMTAAPSSGGDPLKNSSILYIALGVTLCVILSAIIAAVIACICSKKKGRGSAAPSEDPENRNHEKTPSKKGSSRKSELHYDEAAPAALYDNANSVRRPGSESNPYVEDRDLSKLYDQPDATRPAPASPEPDPDYDEEGEYSTITMGQVAQ